MIINYDKVADAIYFKMSEGKVNKTVKMDDRLVADMDKDGNIVGLEMLDASNQLKERGIEKLEQSVLEGIPVQIISGTPTNG